MRAVNLLPRDAQTSHGRYENRGLVAGAAVGAAVVVALGAGFYTAHSRATAEQHRLAAAQAALDRVVAEETAKAAAAAEHGKKAKPIVPVPAVTSEEQPRLAAVSSALSTRIAWDRVLRELSLVIPSDITVSSLSMAAPVAGGASTAAQGVTVSGLAFSQDSVARLLSRLMLVPDLTNVTLGSSTADPTSGKVSFQITASVKGAPVPAAPAAAPVPTTTGATS